MTVGTVTDNGFGDPFNHGLRIFCDTDDYMVVGTANPFYGTQLWRVRNTQYAVNVSATEAAPPPRMSSARPRAARSR